jgi:battenin
MKGVACASISSGFGEITMLQLTSFYSKHTVTAWSSGTGAAGLLGSLSYAGLTGPLKIKPKTAMLILLFIPILQVFR